MLADFHEAVVHHGRVMSPSCGKSPAYRTSAFLLAVNRGPAVNCETGFGTACASNCARLAGLSSGLLCIRSTDCDV